MGITYQMRRTVANGFRVRHRARPAGDIRRPLCRPPNRHIVWIAATLIAAPALAAELPVTMSMKASVLLKAPASESYDWTGFYVGGHLGIAWGRSNWTEQPDGLAGSLNLLQRPDAFNETGSWFGGVQAGYN